ncbi:MAG: helix-turn-helix domain-containing protein [Anaerolineae bacterium]
MQRSPAILPEQFTTFGELLKYLRRRASLTQRELSIAVGYSDTQISRMEQNQRVPDQATLTAQFVPALHLEHAPEWAARLLELAAASRQGQAAPVQPLPFLDRKEIIKVEKPTFVAREEELARLDTFLNWALAGRGQVAFVIGEAGRGKTALVREFTRQAQAKQADLITAGGNCNAYTGLGDPYLPFREILALLTGDVEARWTAGAISQVQAQRLWAFMPDAAEGLIKRGPDLIDTFIPGAGLLARAATVVAESSGWLSHLKALLTRRAAG